MKFVLNLSGSLALGAAGMAAGYRYNPSDPFAVAVLTIVLIAAIAWFILTLSGLEG